MDKFQIKLKFLKNHSTGKKMYWKGFEYAVFNEELAKALIAKGIAVEVKVENKQLNLPTKTKQSQSSKSSPRSRKQKT